MPENIRKAVMKKLLWNPFTCLSVAVILTALPVDAAMIVQSISGAVTSTEISSFKTFMQGRTPPSANTYDNTMADGTAGMDCEALGLMYEVSGDSAILDQMIQYSDAILSLRNDYTDHRVMWTGNVEPVWLTKSSTSSEAGYAGCENNEIVAHIAYCAKLILKTPSLWNTTVPVGDPHGYGATYLQRAKTYVTRLEQTEDNYMTPKFIDTTTQRLKDSTTVGAAFAAFGENTTAWNRQMMFINGWQRLSECHSLLGDNTAKVASYDGIVRASVSWFQTEWQTTTAGGQTCYLWQYAPGHAGGNEEMNGHAAYDMGGLTKAFIAGKYGMTQSLLRPFAESLRYIIYQAGTSYTFAEWINGDTSTTRNYIYSQWMGVSACDPYIFSIMANANISQGSQGNNPIYDATILWVKNARYLGIFAANSDTADFSLTTPWVENVISGTSTNYAVTVNPLAGFAGSTVSFSMSGLPTGVTAGFSAAPNSTLTVSASASVPSGIYAATITGTGSGITRIAPVSLVITNIPVPNFTISASPSSQTIAAGGSTTYTATIGSVNGFAGSVALSVTGLPSGATAGFSPASVTGSGSSTLTVTTTSATPAGSYTLTVKGTSGSLSHTATVTLVVTDFTISVTPASQTVTAGNGTSYTVNLGSANGFNSAVTLGISGLPAGANGTFSPASVTPAGASTLTVTTTTGVSAGSYPLTVTGTSGSLSHNAAATLVVNAPPVTTNNLALGKTATASSIWNATYAASNAIDGTTATRWSAASGQTNNQWLQIDLGTATTFCTVVIKETSYPRVTGFKVQSSTDGTTFTDLATGTTIGANMTVTFNSVSARYVRLYITTASAVPTINEFEVYGSGFNPFPMGWSDSDIGAVGIDGTASYDGTTYTITGSGADIWAASDQFNYARGMATNDVTITVRVASLASANAWSRAGVMIRGVSTTNSAYVGLYVTTGNGISMQYRATNGANSVDLARQAGLTAPYWVRLVRSGDTFTGYSSVDGTTWTTVGTTTVSMAASVRAGLVVCSHDNTQVNTSTFDNLTVQ